MAPAQSRKAIQSYQNGDPPKAPPGDNNEGGVTNEYVLNVAFWTFLSFLLLEAVFAIIANSQSMLEDAEAMSVDAVTYLINLCAERIKHRPYTAKELEMPESVREYKREMTRLYLEVIPPLLSVSTLVAVTGYAINDAVGSLSRPIDVPEDDVDASIMMWFSGANLLLDIVNVTCFARAGQAFGLTKVKREAAPTKFSVRDSHNTIYTQLEVHHPMGEEGYGIGEAISGIDQADDELVFNLNMCSAWTVSIFHGISSSQPWSNSAYAIALYVFKSRSTFAPTHYVARRC
jgi:Co/Zn/Cd efflux system component